MVNQRRSPNRRVVYGVTVGVSAYSLLRGQLRWLRAQGWDVTLVTTPDNAAGAAARREGVPLFPITMSRSITPLSDLRALFQWVLLLARNKPDAVNVSTPKAGLLGGLAAFIVGVPKRVYVMRGLRLEGSQRLLAKILWLSEWLTMQVATDVVFVSRSLAQEAASRGLLPREKSWIIGHGSSNGVDSAAVEARAAEVDKHDLRKRLGVSDDDFVVGFIGRVAQDKGIETLLSAMGSLPAVKPIRLLVIGPSEDEVLESRLSSLGEHLRRIPWTDDVWGHLPAIDVLCLPTLREGFPNVVLEAAAAGIPTITTRATGAIDSVVDGVTGLLVEVGDSATLARHILDLAEDPEKTARLGEAAKVRARSCFQPPTVWRGVSEILADVKTPTVATKIMPVWNGEQ